MLRGFIEAKRREMERARQKQATKNAAIGIGIGSVIGALAGLLFAPQEGKKTREQIASKSKELADKSVEGAQHLGKKINENLHDGIGVAKEKYHALKEKGCCKGKSEPCEGKDSPEETRGVSLDESKKKDTK